jgi:hypothetical protein
MNAEEFIRMRPFCRHDAVVAEARDAESRARESERAQLSELAHLSTLHRLQYLYRRCWELADEVEDGRAMRVDTGEVIETKHFRDGRDRDRHAVTHVFWFDWVARVRGVLYGDRCSFRDLDEGAYYLMHSLEEGLKEMRATASIAR